MNFESDSNKTASPEFIIGPNGRKIILDKDGKPCKSCNTLEDFRSVKGMFGGGGIPGMGGSFGKMKSSLDAGPSTPPASPPPNNTTATATTTTSTTKDSGKRAASLAAFAASAASANLPAADDCPVDSAALGRATWTLLHTMAANYPETATLDEQNDMKSFIKTFARFYPCWWCAKDFRQYIKREEPKVETRQELGWWMCMAHNDVNVKLGKPEFDCNNWLKRWKTGWDDGRCD